MPTIKFNLTSSHNVSLNCKFNDGYSYFMTDRMSVVTVLEGWRHNLQEVTISISLQLFSSLTLSCTCISFSSGIENQPGTALGRQPP